MCELAPYVRTRTIVVVVLRAGYMGMYTYIFIPIWTDACKTLNHNIVEYVVIPAKLADEIIQLKLLLQEISQLRNEV